ncbi:alpha/beta fold hydrolase [Acuticoccus yangtzensis]|uniref:alpha/beta fold hydrolase n=1 Tax=Acuticoccus yangtzensis TaxID=1443441 RepID=UPI0009FA7219|nr:alpha/beta hydrolase [Acuticoccus yangtzensis]
MRPSAEAAAPVASGTPGPAAVPDDPAPAVVFLHAVTRDRSDFDCLRVALGRPSAALDLAGHGDGPRLGAYTAVGMAQHVVLPQGPPPVLYGHSLGGCVALAFAAARPGAIRALVLEDPPLFALSKGDGGTGAFHRGFVRLKEQMTGPLAAHSEAMWRDEVAGWGSGHGRTSTMDRFGPDGVARRARQMAAFDHRVLDGLIDLSIGDGFDPAALLRALDVPVTLIAGDPAQSSVLTADEVRRLDAEFGVRVVQIEGEGHFVHEVLPDPCLEALSRHLD